MSNDATKESSPMSFSGITWDFLEEKHSLQEVSRQVLFENVSSVEPSAAIVTHMKRVRRTRLVNERARAYRLIDPILVELETLHTGRISSVPEARLMMKGMEGLCGNPDFIISGSTTHKLLPIVAVIEAKKDDIEAALPQCVAELYAAFLLNGNRPDRLYGCVTTGTDWQFLVLEGQKKTVCVDVDLYLLGELSRLLGVFCHIIDTTLTALDVPLPARP